MRHAPSAWHALHFGQAWVVPALLNADPEVAHANSGLEVAIYDLDAVRTRLARDPGVATAAAAGRPPIARVAFRSTTAWRPSGTRTTSRSC